ncbi:carbon-nitrogen hydrolase family protein [Litchfieldella xinjiangensis]|uniref:carbon-nitrogen hydrolase family protein n=1 Tax=Litchfieldella xinjiangensis TaxID=1166948 RepID=UPI0005BDA21D|nr:carbon-nitrogen hydrolase family protein [Halomonas xinjiangensis]
MTDASRVITVATAQYPIDAFASFDDFKAKASRWVHDAVARGAQLLVFPEYGAIELASLLPDDIQDDLEAQLHAMQPLREPFVKVWRELAETHGVTLLAPSLPWQVEDGRFVNRAWLMTPNGSVDYQDKQIMTRFENDEWGISSGEGLKIFDTPVGRLGVLICYDSEFPELARALAEADVDLLLVPSCTDTEAGYYRVRHSCQARAIEQQIAVVHSPTVGEALWSPAVDINVGHAAIYTPCDHGLPANGVLCMSQDATPGWQVARLDLDQIRRLRSHGQVNNYADWSLQPARLNLAIERVTF